MSLEELHARALAERKRIMNEIAAEMREEEERLNAARRAARNAERAAEEAEREAKRAAKAALRASQAAARASRPVTLRKRRPGANFEIAGRPNYLAPGAPLRRVEGRRSHNRTLALTRGRRKKV